MCLHEDGGVNMSRELLCSVIECLNFIETHPE